MASLGIERADVYGGVAIVHFPEREYRVALTRNFENLHSLTSADQLLDLAWLDAARV